MLQERNLGELQAQRDELLGGNWLQMDAKARKELIQRFCVGYSLPPLSLHFPTTYRAQRNVDRELFSNVQRLLAPPPELVKQLGRLNKIGEPTLYLSAQPIAAIFETRPQLGDMVTILACRMRPDALSLQLAPVAMQQLRGSHRTGPLNPIYTEGPLGNEWFADALAARGLTAQWQLQDQTLGKLLVLNPSESDHQDLYDLTNGIRDHLYQVYPEYDGMTYPSIVTELTSPNTSLDRHRWKDIEPLQVWVTEVCSKMESTGLPRTILFTKPILKIGLIEEDGYINYSNTNKTFLTVFNEFKQQYGLIRPAGNLKQSLSKPFTRSRISYGRNPNRTVFDFLPG